MQVAMIGLGRMGANVAERLLDQGHRERFRSRDADSISDRLLAMMRHKFGGHAIKKEG